MEDIFSKISSEYDKWYETGFGKKASDLEYKLLLDFLTPPPARILEIGCGTGFFTDRLARDGYDVFGIDISSSMLSVAKRKSKINGKLIIADAKRIPFADNSFDSAVFITSLEFIDNPEDAITEAKRCAEEIIVISLMKNSVRKFYLNVKSVFTRKKYVELGANAFSRKDIEQIAKNCGLKIESVKTGLKFAGLPFTASIISAKMI